MVYEPGNRGEFFGVQGVWYTNDGVKINDLFYNSTVGGGFDRDCKGGQTYP